MSKRVEILCMVKYFKILQNVYGLYTNFQRSTNCNNSKRSQKFQSWKILSYFNLFIKILYVPKFKMAKISYLGKIFPKIYILFWVRIHEIVEMWNIFWNFSKKILKIMIHLHWSWCDVGTLIFWLQLNADFGIYQVKVHDEISPQLYIICTFQYILTRYLFQCMMK